MSEQIQPRVLRFRDAPTYLGMDKNRFNREVRPFVTAIKIGKQGIGFDRLDLDAWFEQYKPRNKCSGYQLKGDNVWDAKERQASLKETGSGTLINTSPVDVFAEAVTQVTSKRLKST